MFVSISTLFAHFFSLVSGHYESQAQTLFLLLQLLATKKAPINHFICISSCLCSDGQLLKIKTLQQWRKYGWHWNLLSSFLLCRQFRQHSGHRPIIFSVHEFDQDVDTMRGTINMIYSCNHGCCGNPTFNTLTSVKAVWIPIPCPLMLVHIIYWMWKHSETILIHECTQTQTHPHKRLLSESGAVLPRPRSLCNTLHLTHSSCSLS